MRKLILHKPDEGLTEYFTWKTAMSTSVTNREARDSVLDYPNETLSLEFTISDAAEMMPTDVQSVGTRFDVFSDALTVRDEVSLPMWHMMSPLASQVLVDSLTMTAVATDSRFTIPLSSGEAVIVNVNGQWTLATAVLSSPNLLTVKFRTPQYSSSDKFTHVVPVRDGLVSTSSFGSAGHYGPAKYKLDALLYRTDARVVLEPFHTAVAGYAGKLALVDRNMTNGSTLSVNSGMLRVETADGFPAHRSLWSNSRVELDFGSEFPPGRLKAWRTFMDLARGSESDFWLPLWDLSFPSSAYGQGAFYAAEGYERFWASSPYKSVAVEFTDGSVQIVTVRGTRTVGGQTICVVDNLFTGAAISRVTVAVLARVSDDVFRFQHFQAFSSVSFKVTAIRNDYSIASIGDKLVEIYGTNSNNAHDGTQTTSASNAGARGNAFSGLVYTSYWNAKEAWSTTGTTGLTYTGASSDFAFMLTSTPFGLAFRIELGTSYGGTGCLLNFGANFRIGIDTAGHVICYRCGRTIVSSAVLSLGSRHSIVFSPGGYSDILYIDGAFDSESSGSFTASAVYSALVIGNGHDGKLGRFEVYNQTQVGTLAAFVSAEFEAEYPTQFDSDYLIVDTSLWDYSGLSAQSTLTSGRDGGPAMAITGTVIGLGIGSLLSAYFEDSTAFGAFAQDLSSWTKYFNGTSDWTISFAVQFGPSTSGECRVIDGGLTTGGIQVKFNGGYLQTVFNGSSSTSVTHSAYIGDFAGRDLVCRITFTSSTKTIRTFVNGSKVAEESFLAFSFSNANMGSAPRFAVGIDWAVPELRLTPGSVDYSQELRSKWFTSLWADVLGTTDGNLMFDVDDSQLLVTYE